MAADADGAAEVEVSPTGWVARQAELSSRPAARRAPPSSEFPAC
ncbi:hypothetical protein SMICM17S_10294 [Streptomyces microflavus]